MKHTPRRAATALRRAGGQLAAGRKRKAALTAKLSSSSVISKKSLQKEVDCIFWQTLNSKSPPCDKMNSNCGNSNAIHPQFHGRASAVANPVTNSALDFFERPSVLINYEESHDQEVFPQVGCRGPQLDFVVTSDSRNLIDLNKITLDLESKQQSRMHMEKPQPRDLSQSVLPTTRSTVFFHMLKFFQTGYLYQTATMLTTTRRLLRRK